MQTPSQSLRAMVRRLVTAGPQVADVHAHEGVRVFETLRIHLTRLVGADGFTSLLRRALTLAKAELPALASVTIRPDGQLVGTDEVEPESVVALAAHLLGLLETFIGKPLTVRLVREAWPDVSFDE